MTVFKPCGLDYQLWGMVALVLLSLLPFLQYPGIEELGSSSSSGVGTLEFGSFGAL